jgi:predicted negative regulator of RcsB-dependent stress response
MSTYKRLPTQKTKPVAGRDVTTFLNKAHHWFETNWKITICGIVAMIIVAGAFLLTKNLFSNRDEKAKNLYYQATRLPFASDEALKAFEKVVDSYSSGKPAELARLKMADIYFSKGDIAKAEEALKGVLDSSDELIKVLALNTLAACKESEGKPKEAAEAYIKAYSEKKNPSRSLSYYNAGLAYMKAGDTDSAKKVFEELSKEGSETASSGIAEKSKEQLIWLASQEK